MKVLVTGGMGYIGSHTIVDLINNGFDVISVDNFSRSTTEMQFGIEAIVSKKITNYNIDLTDLDATKNIFKNHSDIQGIIHFAAYKAVGESVEKPQLYYHNNIVSLINILQCVEEFNVPYFVFSSSCTVYGNPDEVCVTEATPMKLAASPYGATKQMGERIITDFIAAHQNKTAVLLRYFNPVGAHPSAKIGELPIGRPMNLVPAITQCAIGKIPSLTVFGNDYNTRDGSCIRDYIHVCDIAHAHTLALQYLMNKKNTSNCEIYNLGTGTGVTVFEAINAFEKVSNIKLNYTIGPKRSGDVESIYANNNLAKQLLGWQTQYTIEEMMQTAWTWEQAIAKA
ncbi:MAG: UDP-glucose 4-epimerase GalE [Bacteroidetes bacterium]|nr:UDP-glucose 4-epimerase GalE [Bacteroidota bacterium]